MREATKKRIEARKVGALEMVKVGDEVTTGCNTLYIHRIEIVSATKVSSGRHSWYRNGSPVGGASHLSNGARLTTDADRAAIKKRADEYAARREAERIRTSDPLYIAANYVANFDIDQYKRLGIDRLNTIREWLEEAK